MLLIAGADVRRQDIHGSTSLHDAAYRGHTEVCDLLLSAGADANKQDNNGDTPLHHAVRQGHFEAYNLLVTAGADLSIAKKEIGNLSVDTFT